jgi:hypothetical protein
VLQTVVELAEEFVEQVPVGRSVAVTVLSTAPVTVSHRSDPHTLGAETDILI